MTRKSWKREIPFEPDEVQTCEALVAFYERRLDEALEKLGEAIERRGRKKALRLSLVGARAES
jgi:hypothetical protein